MTWFDTLLSDEFRRLSARLGRDPLQVQAAGGNTSIKQDGVMWIKASGTELAAADTSDIFVAVDLERARAELRGIGDGTCRAAKLDTASSLRPSIETTFHAALSHNVVIHTHSVATICHAISPEGRAALAEKLIGLDYALVPYAKPGLPLTAAILDRITPETRVIILQNHGLICCGDTVDQVAELIADIEQRLRLSPKAIYAKPDRPCAADGFYWAEESWLALDGLERVRAGSYYPDHVVFLGPSLPLEQDGGDRPAVLCPGKGVMLRLDATPSQKAMVRCLSDVLLRLPDAWRAEPIGVAAEAELLDWDAEKYRQSLAAQK